MVPMYFARKFQAFLALTLTFSIPGQELLARPSSKRPEESASIVRSLIQPQHAEAIYRHLIELHWTPRTGLFRSFPDSSDLKLSQQASTYEQAAMGLLAIRFGDTDRAKQLFDFFKGTWSSGPEASRAHPGVHGLANFYNADFGSEGIEKIIHMGPNAWVGLCAAKLANVTKDTAAL